MEIFERLTSKTNNPLASFAIGCPEAEGENNSQISIIDVFEDFLGAIQALNKGAFIISGRKGSGKSAIAEYILSVVESDATSFASRINMSDFKIHRMLEVSNKANIDEAFLIEWVLYTQFAKLLVANESITNDPLTRPLNHFLRYNVGYVNISDAAVDELIETRGWNLHAGNLIDIAGKMELVNTKEYKKRKPHYYELLPILRDVIKEIVFRESQKSNKSEYVIFVDDLDVNANINDRKTIDIIYHLIKIARDFNLKYSGIFKVVLLLRSDISQFIAENYPDSGKIISSYSFFINWYDARQFNKDENSIALKKFINKRIHRCFKTANLPCSQDPWYDLIDVSFAQYHKSSFEVVLQSTFLRPRDIISFFTKLSECPPKIPIGNDGFDELFLGLADCIFIEVCNELTFYYDEYGLNVCKAAMQHFSKNDFCAADFYGFVRKYSGIDSEMLLQRFWDYSIIGNIARNDKTTVYFAHRDEQMNMEMDFIIATPIRNHFNRNNLFY